MLAELAIQGSAAVTAQEPGLVGSIVLGLVEGLTEFLPISSTGHLIVADRLLGGTDPAYEVVIQAGAISAIVVLYRRRIAGALLALAGRGTTGDADARSGGFLASLSRNLLVLIVIAAVPAVVLGLGLGDAIEAALFDPAVVGTTMVLGGVALLALERWLDRRTARGDRADAPLESLNWRHALWVGAFQCLALIPGTSRSGATIAGALLLGFRRTAAAEFSFLLGLPILYGACLLQVYKQWDRIRGPLLDDVLIGSVVSFLTALVIVGPFVRFLQRHSFRPFAWYRIVAGILVLALALGGWLANDAS
ncbi:MAG: undecaprenyl-diphosphate phosphatase [Planctomycetes bacterium]|nr:undecaprenyl-diphosphate phosphatase [Planctomycetota bacterium]